MSTIYMTKNNTAIEALRRRFCLFLPQDPALGRLLRLLTRRVCDFYPFRYREKLRRPAQLHAWRSMDEGMLRAIASLSQSGEARLDDDKKVAERRRLEVEIDCLVGALRRDARR